MYVAVNLNAQFYFRAIEIYDKSLNWVLPAKLEFQISISQLLPSCSLRRRLGMAHLTCVFPSDWVNAMTRFHAVGLTLTLPSPFQGEGYYNTFVTFNPIFADSSAFCEPSTAMASDPTAFSSTSPNAMKSSPFVESTSWRVFCRRASVRLVR